MYTDTVQEFLNCLGIRTTRLALLGRLKELRQQIGVHPSYNMIDERSFLGILQEWRAELVSLLHDGRESDTDELEALALLYFQNK